MEFMQNYDSERISEFADEGDPTPIVPAVCARCGEELAQIPGGECGYCTEELNDIAALNFLRQIVVGVELGCAVYALNRAQRHIAKGQYRVEQLQSLAIAVLTEAA